MREGQALLVGVALPLRLQLRREVLPKSSVDTKQRSGPVQAVSNDQAFLSSFEVDSFEKSTGSPCRNAFLARLENNGSNPTCLFPLFSNLRLNGSLGEVSLQRDKVSPLIADAEAER